MSIGKKVIDLTGQEFADLTAAVAEANYQYLHAAIGSGHSINQLSRGGLKQQAPSSSL
jgi:hypothetical protein